MALPLRDFVQQVLLENGRASKIYDAVDAGWSKAKEKYPERARWLRKSTFRGLVWEAVVNELHQCTFDDAGFDLVSHRDTASFVLEDSVLFRFKHADVSLTTSTYPTIEARSFDDHAVDLYGYTGLQRVELCYVLNEFETDIVWTGISARSQGEWLWKIELSSSGIVQDVQDMLPLDNEELNIEKLANLKSMRTDTASEDKKKNDGEL
ncbi:hypothetical protein MRBLRC7O_000091 [Agrobacterium radiobacter]|uniref:hypothetical protein n=1 Tax=Agrobacterium radiobacter TaxID=362 RepID=UPI003467A4E4